MKDNSDTKHRSWLERLSGLLGNKPRNIDELMEVLRQAENRNVLTADVLGMFERILQVSEMQVREVMVTKAQMVVVHKNNSLEDLLPIVIESGHSRFPVVDPFDKEIIGILLAKDLLQYCYDREGIQFNLTDILRQAIFTSQSKRLDILLREFRTNRNHIAIVLDEYGQVAGLVTIEDVLEQIVGEIEDEYDIEEQNGHIKKLNDGSYIIKASTPINEFNEYFHTNFSNDEFDTIGGIVLKGFGHLPKRSETIKIQRFRFKVLHSDNRRIYLLEMKLVKEKKPKTK